MDGNHDFSSSRPLLYCQVNRHSDSNQADSSEVSLSEVGISIYSKSGFSRHVRWSEIGGLTLSVASNEFVIHITESEDERFSCEAKVRKEMLSMAMYLLTTEKAGQKSAKNLELSKQNTSIAAKKKIEVYFVPDKCLDLYQTTLEDLESGQFLRPKQSYCEELDFAGFIQREEKLNKKTSNFSNILNSKVQVGPSDFELLKTLGKGAHGKVLLCKLRGGKGELLAMKILKKRHILDSKQLEHTKAEKDILCFVNHPFLVSLRYAFQTEDKVYFVMEFMKGGELFQHLKKVFQFSEDQTRFFVASLILALGHLHNNDFIYRDLKPENVMLDDRGYAKLTDFGLAKRLTTQEIATTFCGTPEYLAPEVILNKGCNRPADWWSLGILTYELIYGIPPFYSQNIQTMYKNTIVNPLKFKRDTQCSNEAKDFISGLLVKNPAKRLGSIADSLEVMNHPWFKDFDWFNLIEKKLKSPFDPSASSNLVANFDPNFTKEAPKDSICYLDPKVLEEFRSDFAEFSYFASDVEAPQTGETTPSHLKPHIQLDTDPSNDLCPQIDLKSTVESNTSPESPSPIDPHLSSDSAFVLESEISLSKPISESQSQSQVPTDNSHQQKQLLDSKNPADNNLRSEPKTCFDSGNHFDSNHLLKSNLVGRESPSPSMQIEEEETINLNF